MASDAELTAMRQAITLSSFGLGTTSPNPPVGCVILDRHGTAVGAGYHRRKGEAHAEVNALRAAGAAARGGTAVVTLEPCNHVGVTPACRQELINAGIARVVISVIDPTSRGDGGAAVLTAHGIDVETNVLPDETLTVLGPWLAATRRRRPHLTWAYTLGDTDSHDINERLKADLRARADLLLGDEPIEEGTPGGHAPEHFTLPGAPTGDLRQWLSTCYAAGSRTILAVGAQHLGVDRDSLDCVDEIVIAVKRTPPPGGLAAATAHLIPAGFELADISPDGRSVRVRLRRSMPAVAPRAATV
ncbi:bifunctional diaminohydroxyphosphoribosylaminopyrimidine deaminase/5-amino-6-(5-phosphoribosylamino)uracil reductase RibD [Micromonospora chalcea]|uniref:bifunctional diaminohydroxyphosphoribosylaminopyrimidine deaminase/5-amino-6-(5-phosphoribosylamino)uracil reductase RibD n=1 Tax=Micromonospora chalcea TaxID=1874 RepID=UPI001656D4CA|nr:bifunctional diaminohydroxyphosphoribosylaminopyrimidine deaminase/5-amino-6-(5-phosphoribosylamino)uracil reductase RibD [Micromonospora chalcea]MBC8991546.1 bifunctional diaminohydroxyphosphoribosylaminopyrimidine deaminase/5-amino-6-(5-phosphoribosylamino)uracil reductase RibD [Micromonospora chalcea]